MAEPYNPKHPTRPVPLARIVECATYAIRTKPLGYWSYLARFADNDAFKVDPWRWIDIPEAMQDGLDLLADLARLAELLPGGEREVRRMIYGRLEELEAAAAEREVEAAHG
jgi:hypothetical protein